MMLPGECTDAAPKDGYCDLGVPGAQDVLLWGDSHSGYLAYGLSQALAAAGKGGAVAASPGCAPLLGVARVEKTNAEDCPDYNDKVIGMLRASDRFGTVILFARWALNAEGTRPEQRDSPPPRLREVGQETAGGGAAANFPVFEAGLERTVAAVRATGRRVILVEGTPEIGWNVPLMLGNAMFIGAAPPRAPTAATYDARNLRVRQAIEAVAARYGAAVVPLESLLCPGACIVEADGRPLYRDDDHLSRAGAALVAGRVMSALGD